MSANLEELADRGYAYGFVTDVESESAPPGLNEDIVRLISTKKKEPQWLTDWRLKAFRHWLTMPEPTWQFVKYPKIDFQDITYYSAPKQKTDGPKSLSEVDPKLLAAVADLPVARVTEALSQLGAAGVVQRRHEPGGPCCMPV